MQQGITPISPDAGVETLLQLLRRQNGPLSVVVMSRFRDLPTFNIDRPKLPFLRFLEQPGVYFPQVELVVDTDLSVGTDSYLSDHVFQGQRLLPAVMGLEAMAQAVAAVTGSAQVPVFEKVGFNRPIIVPESGSLKIRLAALARGQGVVEVCLRSEETGFQINHFQASCRIEDPQTEVLRPMPKNSSEPVALDPERDLYGGLLFQGGRFRRISNYRLLKAKECVAEISRDGNGKWFSQYLPGKLCLGDPGARDAALHAIQACIPHKKLLPLAVERLALREIRGQGPLFVHARERSRDGDIFVYDVAVKDADGRLYESWEGLQLKAIADAAVFGPWVEALLGPYIERRVQELIPSADISVAFLRDANVERRARSDRAIRSALGRDVAVYRQPDGKPEVNGEHTVSASHTGDLTFAVAGPGPISCDIEPIIERSDSEWLDLLGRNRFELAGFNSRTTKEVDDVSATRIWTVSECLHKIGATCEAPVTVLSPLTDGWILFSSGRLVIASCVTHVQGSAGHTALAVLVNESKPEHTDRPKAPPTQVNFSQA